ncbi:hypothetical protein [Kitasatospora indigofera]|uniref:hypothetical protein n=1 Tax=Kitasatospora indigofera TaxID=67307 RepID=UPI0033B9B740
MLETIRQYSREQMQKTGEEAEMRRRHRDRYLELADRVNEQWWLSPGKVGLFASTRDEHANLRATMEYSLTEPGQAGAGTRMARALWIYWIVCGLPHEGTLWLERSLACETEPDRERAEALWAASLVSAYGGNPNPATVDEILAMMAECQTLAEQLGDPAFVALATYLSGSRSFAVATRCKASPCLLRASSWNEPSVKPIPPEFRPVSPRHRRHPGQSR